MRGKGLFVNSERIKLSKQVALILDSLFIICAFFVSYYLRKPIKTPPFQELAPIDQYLWLLAVTLPFSWISLTFLGIYSSSPRARRNFLILFGRVFLGMIMVLSLTFFVFGLKEVNRTLVIPFLLLVSIFTATWRVVLARWEKARGISKKALFIGEGEKFSAIIQEVREHPLPNFDVVGVLTNEKRRGEQLFGLQVLGKPEDLYNVLHEEVVDEVVFGLPLMVLEQYRTLLGICEKLGVNVLILIDEHWAKFPRVDVGKLYDRPFLYYAATPANELGSWTKAVIDRTIAFSVLLITLPLLILIACLVKVTSRGPILFVQDRTGLNGRRFRMYKFRTMTADAPEKKASLQTRNEMGGPVFKLRNDPRVTRLGAWLRKFSLDEFPQLINVLKGDMSLVGPRPLPCEEAALIHGLQRRRFSVKPGLTCFWQISGRNQLSYDEWMKLDLEYIDQWSLGLDLKILLKTPAAILSSKGAF
jgi:exopolysaccharide biosynthesis polyprenyl glycosylphosphotransferase